MHPSGPQRHVRLIVEVIESISFTIVLQATLLFTHSALDDLKGVDHGVNLC